MMSITNVNELSAFLLEQIERVANGKITPAAANSSSSLAGKVLACAKAQLEFAKMQGTPANVPFLGIGRDGEQRPKLIEGEVSKSKKK